MAAAPDPGFLESLQALCRYHKLWMLLVATVDLYSRTQGKLRRRSEKCWAATSGFMKL